MKKEKSNESFKLMQQWIFDGLDIDRRKISIYDEIGEDIIGRALRSLDLLESISSEPIEISISSFGGDVYSGFALVERMLSSKCDIITIAEGKVMSMGFLLFTAGKIRKAGKYTSFMAHQVSSISMGKLSELEADINETKRLNDLIIEVLGERTDKTAKWWKNETKHQDRYYDVNKALKLGIVTDVI